jgi:G3E family GTPase
MFATRFGLHLGHSQTRKHKITHTSLSDTSTQDHTHVTLRHFNTRSHTRHSQTLQHKITHTSLSDTSTQDHTHVTLRHVNTRSHTHTQESQNGNIKSVILNFIFCFFPRKLKKGTSNATNSTIRDVDIQKRGSDMRMEKITKLGCS